MQQRDKWSRGSLTAIALLLTMTGCASTDPSTVVPAASGDVEAPASAADGQERSAAAGDAATSPDESTPGTAASPTGTDDGPAVPGSTSAPADPGSTTAGDERQDPVPSRFAAAMLTIDDVPDGWERVEEPEDDEQERDGDSGGSITICNKAAFGEGATFEGASDLTGAVFRVALFGPYVTSLAAELPGDQVRDLLTQLDQAGRSCRTWTQVDDDGNRTTFTIEPITFDGLGDQAAAFDISITRGIFSFEMDMVLWRRDGVGAGVIHAGTVGAVDRDLTRRLTRTVARRLDALQDRADG